MLKIEKWTNKEKKLRGPHFADWEDQQLLKRTVIEKGNPMKIRAGDSSTGLATCQGRECNQKLGLGSGRRSEMKIEEPILHWYIMTRRAQTRSHVVFPP